MAVIGVLAYAATQAIQPTRRAGGTFSELVAAAFAAPVDGVATLTLDDDYTVDAAVNVPLGTQLVIDGAGHTLTLGAETNFVINDNITLKDVKIDATALTSPLIALSATPAEGTKKNQAVYTDAAATDLNLLNAVAVENVMVKNLKAQFISNNGAAWALENFSLTKSIIQLDATGKNFIAFDAGGTTSIKNITISENTIYNINETSNAYFIRFNNASNAAKAFGTSNGTSTYDYKLTKNTIINTFKAQNFGNNTPNNGKVTIEATQNIFADVKNISKFVQGNCTKTVEKNVGWGAGQEATISDAIPAAFTAPTTALDLTAENGGIDLKVGASTLAAKNEAGDPRWKVEFVGFDVKVVNTEGLTITPEVTKAAVGEKVYCTYVLAEDYKLERPDFVDDDNNPIEFVDGTTCGLEEVGGVEKMWIIMPAKNVTIKAKVTAMPKFYIIGDMNGWDRTAMTKMTRNEETGRYEYEYAPTTTAYFAFADKQFTEEEAAADPNWDTFNTTRYSLGEGNVDATLDEIKSLVKGVNGTIVLQPGTYKIVVEPDFNAVTITGEVTPPTPVTVDKLYIMGTGTPKGWVGTTELTFNETAQAFEYEATVTTEDTYLTFGDAEFTSWDDFNGKHRYAPGEGNTEAVLDAEVQLVLVNDGNVLLKTPGTYKISVTKDLKMTITTGGTGINGIYVDGEAADIFSDGKPVYNLSGQRVFKGYKGIVIKNGRKVVIK